jgi:DNA-3-methyladenine glycosylase II
VGLRSDVKKLAPGLARAVEHWKVHDPVMARLAHEVPPFPDLSRRHSGFDSLVTSLTHQQVSIAAGRSILRKFRAACGGRITPERVLRLSDAQIRAAGVSRQKMGYIRDLARKTAAREVNFRTFPSMTDAAIVEELTRARGIGVWTAKMFLLFHLARPDIVSPEDLGLRLAVAKAYRVPMSRSARFLERQAPKWSPYGSLASLTLWASKGAPATPKP